MEYARTTSSNPEDNSAEGYFSKQEVTLAQQEQHQQHKNKESSVVAQGLLIGEEKKQGGKEGRLSSRVQVWIKTISIADVCCCFQIYAMEWAMAMHCHWLLALLSPFAERLELSIMSFICLTVQSQGKRGRTSS